MDKDRSSRSRIMGMAAAGALAGVLTLPGLAGAELPGAEIAEQHDRAAPPRVQQAPPERHEFRPGPETRNWGRDRDDRHDRFGRSRDRDDRFARGYWAVPSPEPWYPPYEPAPSYVPGQWVWTGYSWVWQPGYWTN